MDISASQGSIQYEVHTASDSNLISLVSGFISNYTDSQFAGTWMLLVQWDEVPPFPGSFASTVMHFYHSIIIKA